MQRRGQVKSESSVHGVVGQEVVLLKEHGVQGVQHLEGGGKGHQVIDGTSAAHDVFDDQDDVDQGHANEGKPIGLQLQIDTQERGVELAAFEKVHDKVTGVAPGVDVGLLAGPETGQKSAN